MKNIKCYCGSCDNLIEVKQFVIDDTGCTHYILKCGHVRLMNQSVGVDICATLDTK